MKLRAGCELQYELPQTTPMILMLSVHHSRTSDLSGPDRIAVTPPVPIAGYRDGFGNWCSRVLAPAGLVQITTDVIVHDTGRPDAVHPNAAQVPVEHLPEEALVFLLASRFCDSDRLLDMSWSLFGGKETGWARVQDICNFVHGHIKFGYQNARVTRSASEAYEERVGVCRDYAHLAIAFCRALNIPARYCTGYLSDIGTPKPFPPGDFAAWFEAYLGGEWHMFDPRNNTPRIGRVLMARGRDAADVAITTTFGPNTLRSFRVWTDEATGA
jgi:transglutaminase-like putative cysteine protease